MTLSVIVPTYHEAANVPELIARIERVRETCALDLEVVFMDDDSRDGIVEAVAALNKPWVRVVVRTANRGLSPAVLDGFREARGDTLLVMDADLSHPPEKIPEMIAALDAGHDFALGSRYVPGGSTDDQWGLFRWINSRVATWFALPLTSVRDPMSGFFAIRRETFDRADALNPVGYKIALELLIKCGCKNVCEVPIHFSKRAHGESKLSFKEQLRYLEHVRRLYTYRYGNWSHFVQFGLVGLSGTVVNLAVLTVELWAGVPLKAAVAVAILVSMITNFLLNRRFTFSYAGRGPFWRQMFGFIAASSVGAVVNYGVTLGALSLWPALIPQIASIMGILAGLIFNFFASRYIVFAKSHPNDV
ncbi:MAG TPA: glycosyltransferase family 2 protein [Candidatus Hydrogenedentes bacterium]|mgnify:FL=1|nr:glycosyltransferase family 2 protein [Candidatus Hydrogenedentota bacterium]HOV74694.1 glycosyltransferase family 2 protein [Candidatus Hydrogenedentota bacterium]HPC18209.1 glycosyltransferase family 2 protein [Candidatus Hydrogenedentota bacterium]HRT20458.1 glycosyltransferase family 2 protein [Candidatus Hydrogenedentota bacterium]HRT65207.1 glycosyltransferase family 2 protein [Candidatus Hydrogenedentota bacterium]